MLTLQFLLWNLLFFFIKEGLYSPLDILKSYEFNIVMILEYLNSVMINF